MFGWHGPESERPWAWARLADVRQGFEAQERAIAWHVRPHPSSGIHELGHYPPADRVRLSGVMFQQWLRLQEVREAMLRDETAPARAQFAFRWTVTDEAGRARELSEDQRVPPEQRVHLFQTMRRQKPLGVSGDGLVVRPRLLAAGG